VNVAENFELDNTIGAGGSGGGGGAGRGWARAVITTETVPTGGMLTPMTREDQLASAGRSGAEYGDSWNEMLLPCASLTRTFGVGTKRLTCEVRACVRARVWVSG
jgi:hypothetical protein